MKVSYTQEQRAKAVKVYRKTKSFAQTIRILGYPSRHILFDWVKHPNPKPKSKQPRTPAKRYSWQLKRLAVAKVISGQDIKEIAYKLGIVSYDAPSALINAYFKDESGSPVEEVIADVLPGSEQRIYLDNFTAIKQFKDYKPNAFFYGSDDTSLGKVRLFTDKDGRQFISFTAERNADLDIQYVPGKDDRHAPNASGVHTESQSDNKPDTKNEQKPIDTSKDQEQKKNGQEPIDMSVNQNQTHDQQQEQTSKDRNKSS
ncbi:hypothetical protein [Collinsella ureilytica]|uniref:hypothetical protein n=1 Tax=Collinsella ureilytica TaxID=2869515 RepID=UPI0027D2539B|nr:hypothetical protein [Collinsella urealyticum]